MGADLDVFDYCSGPDGSGCEMIPDRSDDLVIGHCPTCRVVFSEMGDDD